MQLSNNEKLILSTIDAVKDHDNVPTDSDARVTLKASIQYQRENTLRRVVYAFKNSVSDGVMES